MRVYPHHEDTAARSKLAAGPLHREGLCPHRNLPRPGLRRNYTVTRTPAHRSIPGGSSCRLHSNAQGGSDRKPMACLIGRCPQTRWGRSRPQGKSPCPHGSLGQNYSSAFRRGAREADVLSLAARQSYRRLGGRAPCLIAAVPNATPLPLGRPAGAAATRPIAVREDVESTSSSPFVSPGAAHAPRCPSWHGHLVASLVDPVVDVGVARRAR